MSDELNDFVRAVAEDKMVWFDAESIGQFSFEIEGVAVRVEMELAERFFHRCQRQWGRAKWIFVRGELDNVTGGNIEFARYLFDRAARLIGGHRLQCGVNWEHGK